MPSTWPAVINEREASYVLSLHFRSYSLSACQIYVTRGIDLGQKVDLDRDISTVHVSLMHGDWLTADTILFQGLI